MPPGQMIPMITARTITTPDAIAIVPHSPNRQFLWCESTYQMTPPIASSVRMTSHVRRGWRVNRPPVPATPEVPGRMSQISSAVPRMMPAAAAMATYTSERGRTATYCWRDREGLIAASPFHHPPDHDRDLVEEVHGNSHEE